MTDKTMNRILLAAVVLAAAVMYGLVMHQEYTEARIGSDPCVENVKGCE